MESLSSVGFSAWFPDPYQANTFLQIFHLDKLHRSHVYHCAYGVQTVFKRPKRSSTEYVSVGTKAILTPVDLKKNATNGIKKHCKNVLKVRVSGPLKFYKRQYNITKVFHCFT